MLIDLRDYVATLRSSIPYVHPAGRATIDAWLANMGDAADRGDTITFARFAKLIADKIELELQWQREDMAALPP